MRMKTALSLGTFAIVALLVAGLSYRLIREQPASLNGGTEVATPPNPGRGASQHPQPAGRENSAAPAAASRAPAAGPSPDAKPAAPATASRAPTDESSPETKPPAAAPRAPAGGSGAAARPTAPPPAAAPAPTMPAENRMSAANRRKVQEALQHRGYYQGPVDGIFGPRTRAAIRRFQDSIGAKSTGHLTAVEASRLVSES